MRAVGEDPTAAYAAGENPLRLQYQALLIAGTLGGIAFTWGELYTRFARQVMDGTWKSEALLGNLGSDYLTIAPFGPGVPADAVKLVNERKQEFINGKREVFQGPIKYNKGIERAKAGEVFPIANLGRMDWPVEGVIGQAK